MPVMKDRDMFNCSEKHELDYVAKQYDDKEKVAEFIKSKCKDGTIKRWTHTQLYQLLKENGFNKKK